MHKNAIDLTGKRFGKLIVLEYTDTRKDGSVVWKCGCNCGNVCFVKSVNLTHNFTKSCGCLRLEHTLEMSNKNKKEFGVANFNSLYSDYRKSARDRDLSFELTKNEFRELTQQNCSYCGREPKQIDSKKIVKNGYYIYNGIDRVDNSKGYILENCVPCCGRCNKMKGILSRNEFLYQIFKIHDMWKDNFGTF